LATKQSLEQSSRGSQKAAQLEAARVFFERLWWHDQVVFDISEALIKQLSLAAAAAS
jgi:hypothetical protein